MDEDLARARIDKAFETYEQVFEKFFLTRLIDLSYEYGENSCKITFPVADFLFNPQGSLHGGVIATVVDISMGHLVKKVTGKGGATIEMKLNYMRPITGGTVTCEGRFLRQGRTMSVLESNMWSEDGKLCVHATSTYLMPKA